MIQVTVYKVTCAGCKIRPDVSSECVRVCVCVCVRVCAAPTARIIARMRRGDSCANLHTSKHQNTHAHTHTHRLRGDAHTQNRHTQTGSCMVKTYVKFDFCSRTPQSVVTVRECSCSTVLCQLNRDEQTLPGPAALVSDATEEQRRSSLGWQAALSLSVIPRTHARMHAGTHTHTHAIHACSRTHKHTHKHTHTHTQITGMITTTSGPPYWCHHSPRGKGFTLSSVPVLTHTHTHTHPYWKS